MAAVLRPCAPGRLARLAGQAQVQRGLLTVEDLSYLTSSSTATVKRDLAACRARDEAVPTRGQIKDIRPGLSHKANGDREVPQPER